MLAGAGVAAGALAGDELGAELEVLSDALGVAEVVVPRESLR